MSVKVTDMLQATNANLGRPRVVNLTNASCGSCALWCGAVSDPWTRVVCKIAHGVDYFKCGEWGCEGTIVDFIRGCIVQYARYV